VLVGYGFSSQPEKPLRHTVQNLQWTFSTQETCKWRVAQAAQAGMFTCTKTTADLALVFWLDGRNCKALQQG
jgi:hypothetical protein